MVIRTTTQGFTPNVNEGIEGMGWLLEPQQEFCVNPERMNKYSDFVT
jgi:hypothetical protein